MLTELNSVSYLFAVLRYEIEHPVVNDGGMSMWRALGVNSWPTLAVVSPNGRLIAMVAGERGRLVGVRFEVHRCFLSRCLLSNSSLPVEWLAGALAVVWFMACVAARAW